MKHVLVRDSGSKFQYKGLEAQIYIYIILRALCADDNVNWLIRCCFRKKWASNYLAFHS